MTTKENSSTAFLSNIHLKLLILSGIVVPCLTASGAYWSIKLQVVESNNEMSNRVAKVESESTKNFVGKQSFDELSHEVKDMHDDVLEIKTLIKLQQRSR